MFDRSIRRHHLERAKRRAKKFSCFAYQNKEPSEKAIGRAARTPCSCSCPMCGNQRHNKWAKKKGKLTRQELRADLAIRADKKAVLEDTHGSDSN